MKAVNNIKDTKITIEFEKRQVINLVNILVGVIQQFDLLDPCILDTDFKDVKELDDELSSILDNYYNEKQNI